MKTLLLLRHAKSAWDPPALNDHERPLATRGRTAAPRMAAAMIARNLKPDLILCSSAKRTRQTLELLGEAVKGVTVRFEDALYLAEAVDILTRVRRLRSAADSVLVVGHNPGLEDLARTLVGSGTSRDRARLDAKFPTAALAVIAFDVSRWRDIEPSRGRLDAFLRPKHL